MTDSHPQIVMPIFSTTSLATMPVVMAKSLKTQYILVSELPALSYSLHLNPFTTHKHSHDLNGWIVIT